MLWSWAQLGHRPSPRANRRGAADLSGISGPLNQLLPAGRLAGLRVGVFLRLRVRVTGVVLRVDLLLRLVDSLLHALRVRDILGPLDPTDGAARVARMTRAAGRTGWAARSRGAHEAEADDAHHSDKTHFFSHRYLLRRCV